MAQALNNIFSAIIKSEMIAEVEKKRHKEVKDGVEQFKMKLQKQECLKAEHLTKKRQLEFAVADTNIGMKLFKVREEMLTKELTAIAKKTKLEKNKYSSVGASPKFSHEKHKVPAINAGTPRPPNMTEQRAGSALDPIILEKQDDINRNLAVLCSEFVKNVTKFSRDYGTSSSGIERRIHSAKECLRILESDKDSLELDVKTAIEIKDNLKRILDYKSNKVDELKAITSQIDDVEKDIYTEMVCTEDLEKKISQLITEPDCGTDFVKVKEELHKYEVTDLQSQINQFHSELQSLTGILHRKEAQTLQQQYKKWQRQQHLKSKKSCKKETSFDSEQSSSITVIKESFSPKSDTMEHTDLIMIPDEPVNLGPYKMEKHSI